MWAISWADKPLGGQMGKVIVEVNVHEFATVLRENSQFTVVQGLPQNANIEGWEYDGKITVSILVSSPNYPEIPEGSPIPKKDIKLEAREWRKQ